MSGTRGQSTVNIMSIQGGLGNQLFEWAFAYALGRRGGHVVFDVVRCRGDRPLEIGPLLAGHKLLPRSLGYAAVMAHKSGVLGKCWFSSKRWQLRREPGFGYSAEFMDELLTQDGGSTYVLGYFQSPKYFIGYEAEVRSAVSGLLRGMLTERGVAMAAELAASPNTVAVHVRRGDYISNLTASAHHGNLQEVYYQQALALMRRQGKDNIVWFSDDTDWVSGELAGPLDTVATPAMMAALTHGAGGEIALMAACSSRIIANSSFSWWAGWLGAPSTAQSPVVAPSQWLAGQSTAAIDLVPGEWLRL